ncbi:MAG: FtsX-like permease family protein, partial [Vicinamibacterales bacterium]
ITPMSQAIVGQVRPYLLALAAAVGFVLLIACANVSSLQLARSLVRRREFAVRAALGASPSRVVQQLVIESVTLACAGGVVGLCIAAWGTRAALAALPAAVPRANAIQVDGRVLLFTLGVSILCGVLFGLAPAWRASRPELRETLKEGGRGASGSQRRAQDVFVVAETALAVLLLVGAGLMLRSLARLWSVDTGFQADGVFTVDVALPPSMHSASTDAVRAVHRRLADQIAAVPGVVAQSPSWGALPLVGDDEALFWIDGTPRPTSPNDMLWTIKYVVGPDYLKVMRAPLLRGRFISPRDDEHAAPVGVVDEVFAQTYFSRQDAIGRLIDVDGYDRPVEIVGILKHENQWGLDSDSTQPLRAELFLPFMQLPDAAIRQTASGVTFAVRAADSPMHIADDIQRALRRTNADTIVANTQTLDDVISQSLGTRRFAMMLFSLFGAAALLLAALGIYGVLAQMVGQRQHELAVRVALGARAGDIMRLVAGGGLRLAAIGVAGGLLGAAGLTRLMRTLIFDVRPFDPPTFAAVTVLLLAAALAACWMPARRAARADPLAALRGE